MLVLTRRKSQRIVIPIAEVFGKYMIQLYKDGHDVNQLLADCDGDHEKFIASTNKLLGEKGFTDDNIVCTVTEVKGDKVRLGWDAPRIIPVHRQEVFDAIVAANGKSAANGDPEDNGDDSGS